MQTRRSFLHISAATVAGAVLPPFASAQSKSAGGDLFAPATLGAYQQNLLTKERMESLIGSLFMVFLDNGNVAYLTLGKVVDLADLQPATVSTSMPVGHPIVVSQPLTIAQPIVSTVRTNAVSIATGLSAPATAAAAVNTTRAKGYVAIFNGETSKVTQGTYVVDHGRLGRVTIFMVPGRNDAGNTTVVATFASM